MNFYRYINLKDQIKILPFSIAQFFCNFKFFRFIIGGVWVVLDNNPNWRQVNIKRISSDNSCFFSLDDGSGLSFHETNMSIMKIERYDN